MGCDIHTACEVKHPDNGWVIAGDVFSYPYDTKFFEIDELFASTLSDGQLMEAVWIYYYKLVKGPRDENDFLGIRQKRWLELDETAFNLLSLETIEVLQDYKKRQDEVQKKIEAHRDAQDRRTWDYYKNVQPFEHKVKLELRESVELTPRMRDDLLVPVLTHREGNGERWYTRLEWLPGDAPIKDSAPYHGRDYTLFAALADVRNGYGFAGIDLGDRIKYIDDPRGVPEDVSPEGDRFLDMYGIDGHSHSWLTVEEIEEWEGWEQTQVIRGVVSAQQYEELKENGEPPTDYSGDIIGQGIVTVPWTEYDEYMARREKAVITEGDLPEWATNPSNRVHVKMQWTRRLRDEVNDRWWQAVEEMKELAPNGDTSKVRMIFFFDN